MTAISELRRAGEDHCADFLRCLSDDFGRHIKERHLTAEEAREMAASLRFQARLLFPDRMDTYDRIYGARFQRLITQFLAAKLELT
jgi:hypothetical protein